MTLGAEVGEVEVTRPVVIISGREVISCWNGMVKGKRFMAAAIAMLVVNRDDDDDESLPPIIDDIDGGEPA